MEHGRLVIFENHFRYTPYIAVKHEGHYLFLSLDNLNRLEDFVLAKNIDKHKDLFVNVKTLMIPDIIENHIEEMDTEYKPVEEYRTGMILRNKITEELSSMIIIKRFEEYSYYLIDLNTFELQDIKGMIRDKSIDNQFSYVKDNYYTYDFNFDDLDIKVRR